MLNVCYLYVSIYMQDTETCHIHREDVCKIYESEFSSSLSMIFTLHISDILHQKFFKPSVFPRLIKYLLVYDENI